MPGEPERIAVAFAKALRDETLTVTTSSLLQLVDAFAAVGLDRREHVYWAGRATLVRRPEEIPAYDRAFRRLWLGAGTEADPAEIATVALATDEDDPEAGVTAPSAAAERTVAVRYSAEEILRSKNFADYDAEELAELRRLFARLRVTGSLRRTRRLTATRGRGPAPDVRATVRASLRSSGEPLRYAYRERTLRPRAVVVLCDMSGSMALYSRVLIRFVHAAVAGRTRVEAFTIGTRLTRVTRDLRSRDPDAALRAAAARAPDWSGGTRLGGAIRSFNDSWGVRGMARGAIVVILSDGWDRGDPQELGAQMQRLHRVAHRIVWVNPLKATAGYAPTARGMAAALPFIDRFVEGHSLASLESLAEVIAA